MFDAALNLNKNIKQTLSVCNLIRKHDVSVEVELGFVGYNNNSKSSLTNPDEAKYLLSKQRLMHWLFPLGMFTFRNIKKIILI